jgi:hypothetical protein
MEKSENQRNCPFSKGDWVRKKFGLAEGEVVGFKKCHQGCYFQNFPSCGPDAWNILVKLRHTEGLQEVEFCPFSWEKTKKPEIHEWIADELEAVTGVSTYQQGGHP